LLGNTVTPEGEMTASRTRGGPGGNRATGRPRRSRDEVREALLDAAYAEFAERGYGAASVESIAQRAGLTKGAVYGNFDGKFGLFLGLIHPDRMNRAAFFDGLGGEPGDPEASLARIARAVHRQTQDLVRSLVMAEARGYAARSPELAARFAEVRTELMGLLAPLFEAELARVGLAPIVPIREILYAVVALFNGVALEQVGIAEPVLSVEVIERLLRSLITVAPA
jgi:AcrR family transcriptional regulator